MVRTTTAKNGNHLGEAQKKKAVRDLRQTNRNAPKTRRTHSENDQKTEDNKIEQQKCLNRCSGFLAYCKYWSLVDFELTNLRSACEADNDFPPVS